MHRERLERLLRREEEALRVARVAQHERNVSREQVAVLDKLDINLVQGFFYAKAMPADEAFAWVTEVDRAETRSQK